MGRFDGRTVVVTGAASGIGHATVQRLIDEGADVVGADVAGGDAVRTVDVTDESAVASLMDEAAYPWQAAWYRRQVEGVLGDGIDDQYRLWFVDQLAGPSPTYHIPMALRLSGRLDRDALRAAFLDAVPEQLRKGLARQRHGGRGLDMRQVPDVVHGYLQFFFFFQRRSPRTPASA